MKNEPTSSPATIDQDIAPEIKPPTSQFEVSAKKDQIEIQEEDIHKGEPGLLHKLMRKKKLEGFFLFVTSRCNAKCKTCFYHEELNSNEDLTFEEIKKISETSPKFDKLWLSGGEPFMREDLVEIIKLFYDNNNVRVINLPTNGLLTKKIDTGVGRLLKECPELSIHLNFSIDGLGKTHDSIRGVAGNFRKTIASMELIKEKYSNNPKLLQNVATVVTPEALDEIFDLGVYLHRKDLISTQFFEVVRGDPKDPSTKNITKEQIRDLRKRVFPLIEEQANKLFKDFKGAKKKLAKTYFLGFVRFVNQLQDDNYFGPKHWGMSCTAGKTTIVVDHNGAFRSCEIRPPIGKLQDYDFNITKALYSEAMKKEIDEIGGGRKANCWCTHGCWIMSSLKFSPRALLFRIPWAHYKSKSDRIRDFKLPDIDNEAIENY
jgi:MoaA/NifB/PqqE/SkfB family radical SAM enzyme